MNECIHPPRVLCLKIAALVMPKYDPYIYIPISSKQDKIKSQCNYR